MKEHDDTQKAQVCTQWYNTSHYRIIILLIDLHVTGKLTHSSENDEVDYYP